jgi:hypothetical protein
VKACTISLHLAGVEAIRQIAETGPLKEALAAWVERLNFRLIEQVSRRRVCKTPEKSIIRGYLLELFRDVFEDEIPDLSSKRYKVSPLPQMWIY